MKVIDVSKPGKIQRVTVLSYGMSRSGKTRFAGSWPRPLFLSDATESGWTTLANMDRNVLFEAGRDPIVWSIEKAADMMQAVHDAEALIRRGDIHTVVVDSLTFYADLFFNTLDAGMGNRGDPRQLYQKLGQHLKNLREQIHLLGSNVVWLALEKPPGEDTPIGGPMLSGQNAAKFAAGCDYVFYHRSFQNQPNAPLQWEIRTRKYNQYQAGGRDEGRLPDPLGYVQVPDEEGGQEIFVPDCTYRTMAEALGILTDTNAPVAVAPATDDAAAIAAASSNGKGRPQGRPVPPTTAQPGRPSR
jgi:AAA domain-containing protein